eukprot:TRINITY_DN3700_c0_g2_i4.p1 TRINITY_DN3700_c0_g2~~TRINITY_DN3700_c0_g2_i4.p1  ORF type:complete len:921 (-),score=299.85 TRINITY_DN3700_c0_g2_i4:108-2870(-)
MNIKGLLADLVASQVGEFGHIHEGKNYVSLCALYAFYFRLFPEQRADSKFFRQLWDQYRRRPVVHLCGNVVWYPTDFFKRLVPEVVVTLGKQISDVDNVKIAHLKEMDVSFASQVRALHLKASVWMVRIESNLSNKADIRQVLNMRITLLNQGLLIAFEVGRMFKEYTYLHDSLRVPVKSSHVPLLCQCVELIKAIQASFHRRSAMIGESISYMVQQVSFYLQRSIRPIQAKLEKDKKYSEQKLDVLAAVKLCLQILNGCATKDRRLLLRIAMHVIFQMRELKDQEIADIKQLIIRLDLVCDFQDQLKEACDCSFFYWSRVMIPSYFRHIFKHPDLANRLQYMVASLQDVVPLFNKAVHVDCERFTNAFKKEVFDALDNEISRPLSRAIETDLRLHIHSHLKVSDRDPFGTGVKDLCAFVNLKPLRFMDRLIDFKQLVAHYLDTTFYNLTTVALYDWKTYAEMRNLAKQKYGLQLTEVHLPGQTLEQGLDVLEIMRNIHIFVGRYKYNLNTQVFIETTSESKTLNTINIRIIANSIRTHGTGIMNTTVNFTYQFLRRKFVIFSQFLYDDHIKSRLYKDVRFFKEKKEELELRYPYDRADKFNKEIRRLGILEGGHTYLDQFRILITHIGNAMGYIRMVRSGGFEYLSNAIRFVPDLRNITKFEDLCSKDGLHSETINAARNLDTSIDNLVQNFSEGTAYFKMLVSVFAPEFRSDSNKHLKFFYAIVPPLTVNFIDHSLIMKDKMRKTTKAAIKDAGAGFTDDGFAIGIAYILRLLDQNELFDTLHWFESVSTHFRLRNDDIRERAAKAKGKREQEQTLTLTAKKIEKYTNEFKLLRYSFKGARIFFKDATPDAAPVDEQPVAQQQEPPSVGDAGGGPPPPPMADAGGGGGGVAAATAIGVPVASGAPRMRSHLTTPNHSE